RAVTRASRRRGRLRGPEPHDSPVQANLWPDARPLDVPHSRLLARDVARTQSSLSALGSLRIAPAPWGDHEAGHAVFARVQARRDIDKPGVEGRPGVAGHFILRSDSANGSTRLRLGRPGPADIQWGLLVQASHS